MLLISNVDILMLYAICALVLTMLIRLPAAVLAAGGVALIYGPDIFFPDWQVQGWADAALQHYGHGNFADILAFRWSETRALIIPLLILTAQRAAGLMLIGIAVWRLRSSSARRNGTVNGSGLSAPSQEPSASRTASPTTGRTSPAAIFPARASSEISDRTFFSRSPTAPVCSPCAPLKARPGLRHGILRR